MTAETSQFIIKGYGVELVNNMADFRAAIRRDDKAIGAGNRAAHGLFVALTTIWQLRGVWRPLAKRFAKYWLQTKGLPDNLFETWDFVEHDGHFYLVPIPRPDRIDPYGLNKSRPATARPN
jgi:hypothetical protein